MQNIVDMLMKTGLSEKETIIYMSILKNWTSSLTNISDLSWIKRTTIYGYLDLLLWKGLISKTIKSKRILYKAENPQNILKEMNKKVDLFSKFLPQIIDIYSASSSRPDTTIYDKI